MKYRIDLDVLRDLNNAPISPDITQYRLYLQSSAMIAVAERLEALVEAVKTSGPVTREHFSEWNEELPQEEAAAVRRAAREPREQG